ncbi:MAG: hypothetical protein KGL39_59290 [Patescibacteria group bacterium]|nr:hypothetical protein [Patescibacteria group bacterium]
MNDELDKLRPEVREAFKRMDRDGPRGYEVAAEWRIVRAELLRLENAGELREAHEIALKSMAKDLQRVEAELAALKAKIAESAHADVTLGCAIDGEIPPDLALCKVALVKVEE